MKLAFIILVHKYPEQVAALINTLDKEGDHFYIHIDKKSNDSFTEIKKDFSESDNVFFVKNNVSCDKAIVFFFSR